MSFSTLYERRVLDKVLGGVDFTPPATLYLALSTTPVADDGSGLTEPAVGGYARLAVPNNEANFPATPAVVPSTKTNGLQLAFPATTAAWGDIVGAALMDAAAGGNLVARAAIVDANGDPTILSVTEGTVVRFQPGTLIFLLD